MLPKVLIVVTAAAISIFCLNGCKKRPSEPAPGEGPVKTLAEYKAEAEEEITEKNLEEELARLEKEIEEDIGGEGEGGVAR